MGRAAEGLGTDLGPERTLELESGSSVPLNRLLTADGEAS